MPTLLFFSRFHNPFVGAYADGKRIYGHQVIQGLALPMVILDGLSGFLDKKSPFPSLQSDSATLYSLLQIPKESSQSILAG